MSTTLKRVLNTGACRVTPYWAALLLSMSSLSCAGDLADGSADVSGSTPQPKSFIAKGGSHFTFALTRGKGTPVCDAYVKRLNLTVFHQFPNCDRPENTEVPGFTKLNRIPLTSGEISRLYASAQSLVQFNDPAGFAKWRTDREKRGLYISPGNLYDIAVREQAVRLELGQSPFYYQYEPRIDIDNDGHADNVVVWKGTTNFCGAGHGPADDPLLNPTYLMVLDGEGNLDVERTRRLFEHPEVHQLTFTNPKTGEKHLLESVNHGFIGRGSTLGVFSYRGTIYFDTFHDWLGDINENVPLLTQTLSVYRARRGEVREMCEIQWTDSSYPYVPEKDRR